MFFSDRLKALREDNDLTQEELAKDLQITRSALANYETGFRQPDIKTLIKIADYFDISLDYLLCRISLRASFSKSLKKNNEK